LLLNLAAKHLQRVQETQQEYEMREGGNEFKMRLRGEESENGGSDKDMLLRKSGAPKMRRWWKVFLLACLGR
jgi:hypothetical protein